MPFTRIGAVPQRTARHPATFPGSATHGYALLRLRDVRNRVDMAPHLFLLPRHEGEDIS
jgi:hypothetical protein